MYIIHYTNTDKHETYFYKCAGDFNFSQTIFAYFSFFIFNSFFVYLPTSPLCQMYYNNNCIFLVWNMCGRVHIQLLNIHDFQIKVAYGLLLSSFDKLNYCTQYELVWERKKKKHSHIHTSSPLKHLFMTYLTFQHVRTIFVFIFTPMHVGIKPNLWHLCK